MLSTFFIRFHCKDPQECIGLIFFFSPDNFSFSRLISVFCPVNTIPLLDVLGLAYSDKHIDKEPFPIHFTLESYVNHWLSFGCRGLLLTSRLHSLLLWFTSRRECCILEPESWGVSMLRSHWTSFKIIGALSLPSAEICDFGLLATFQKLLRSNLPRLTFPFKVN